MCDASGQSGEGNIWPCQCEGHSVPVGLVEWSPKARSSCSHKLTPGVWGWSQQFSGARGNQLELNGGSWNRMAPLGDAWSLSVTHLHNCPQGTNTQGEQEEISRHKLCPFYLSSVTHSAARVSFSKKKTFCFYIFHDKILTLQAWGLCSIPWEDTTELQLHNLVWVQSTRFNSVNSVCKKWASIFTFTFKCYIPSYCLNNICRWCIIRK